MPDPSACPISVSPSAPTAQPPPVQFTTYVTTCIGVATFFDVRGNLSNSFTWWRSKRSIPTLVASLETSQKILLPPRVDTEELNLTDEQRSKVTELPERARTLIEDFTSLHDSDQSYALLDPYTALVYHRPGRKKEFDGLWEVFVDVRGTFDMLAEAMRARNMKTSRDRAKGDVGKTGEDGVGVDDLHEAGVDDLHEAGVDDLHEAGVDDLHEVGLDELHEVGVDGRQATEASRHEDGLREKGWSEKWSWERWFKFGKNRPKALKVFKTRTASLV